MTLTSTQNQKTIFITGSPSGLGRATAKLFASKGWKVIATMRNPEKETELNNISGVALMALDITNPKQIVSVAETVMASGAVDVVFNNAGYGLSGPLEGLTDEQIMRMVNTNMLGAIRTTKAFVPYFREKRAGLFINTTSIGGLMTVPFNSIYHATKWALEGWSESMAFELNQFGIGMKTVSPGGMKTDFFTRSFDTGRHQAYDELVDRVMSKITDPKQMQTYSSPGQNRRGGLRSRHRRKETTPLYRWRGRNSDLCYALEDGRRSFPQRDKPAGFWTIHSSPPAVAEKERIP